MPSLQPNTIFMDDAALKYKRNNYAGKMRAHTGASYKKFRKTSALVLNALSHDLYGNKLRRAGLIPPLQNAIMRFLELPIYL